MIVDSTNNSKDRINALGSSPVDIKADSGPGVVHGIRTLVFSMNPKFVKVYAMVVLIKGTSIKGMPKIGFKTIGQPKV
ncbi:hypothetical protein KZ870_37570, partial [Pseudomonas aeruginosa]|nr:hypothetical protein [Pseudomonas aeruginosa]